MSKTDYEKYKERIADFYYSYKRMPSYREIADLAGFASKNAAYQLVQKMIEEGVVEKDAQGKIIPKHLLGQVRVLGSVEAGFPSPAEEELLDTMNLDEFMIEKREATYLLVVKGDSMKDAGIQEGDMVLVERSESAKSGDIVIANIDGEWTMKYLRSKNGTFYLEAANKKYPNMYPSDDLEIGGVVKGVIRKYR